jgi:DNA polymerase
MTRLHLDYELKSELDVTDVGVDLYANHPSTTLLMTSFKINDEATQQWVPAEGERMPSDLKEGLRDPEVLKIAFNAQFERWITERVLGIEQPVEAWRCSMALAYMFSFMGGLDDVGAQMALSFQKSTRGRQLIKIFCGPNKPTKNQPFVWRDRHSDPEEWEEFKAYNVRDTDSEHELWSKLIPFDMPEWQWGLYHLDQIINDRGLPINRTFVENALTIAERRKAELISEQDRITGLANSNSGAQLLPWLMKRGYPYDNLRKENVQKALVAEEEEVANPSQTYDINLKDFVTPTYACHFNALGQVVGDAVMTQECRTVLRLRQGSAKTSTTKYAACLAGLGIDDRLRHCFQYAGGSRTNRWAGRKIQPQNLPRTPKWLEPEDYINFDRLDYCNYLIAVGDYETLGVFAGEQMEAVAGCVRSCIQAPPGKKLVVCDLSSIETVTIGWLAECERLLNVFRDGKDAYKDFGSAMYKKPYEEVTKGERQIAKPAVLGSGYRLGGGDLRDGEKTGLWAYAEGMGVKMTKEEANTAVTVFRETYAEIPQAWYDIERAIVAAAQAGGRTIKWNSLEFQVKKPFLRVKLPSGRYMYYYKLTVEPYEAISRKGNPYTRYLITYMGKDQVTQQWRRIESHGGKFIENFVQAIARDILGLGMLAAHAAGFYLVGHVHDEIISEEDENDEEHSYERLRYLMSDYLVETVDWLKNMPLGAAGYEAKVYRKD